MSHTEEEITRETEGTEGPCCVVGIGASAGGLEALQDFFKAMPADTGAAFVVVQHLSPDHKSLMAELLSRCTTMTVKAAQDGQAAVSYTHLDVYKRQVRLLHDHFCSRSEGDTGKLLRGGGD